MNIKRLPLGSFLYFKVLEYLYVLIVLLRCIVSRNG